MEFLHFKQIRLLRSLFKLHPFDITLSVVQNETETDYLCCTVLIASCIRINYFPWMVDACFTNSSKLRAYCTHDSSGSYLSSAHPFSCDPGSKYETGVCELNSKTISLPALNSNSSPTIKAVFAWHRSVIDIYLQQPTFKCTNLPLRSWVILFYFPRGFGDNLNHPLIAPFS